MKELILLITSVTSSFSGNNGDTSAGANAEKIWVHGFFKKPKTNVLKAFKSKFPGPGKLFSVIMTLESDVRVTISTQAYLYLNVFL